MHAASSPYIVIFHDIRARVGWFGLYVLAMISFMVFYSYVVEQHTGLTLMWILGGIVFLAMTWWLLYSDRDEPLPDLILEMDPKGQ